MTTLSVYYDPQHDREGDKEYIQQLQPAWVRIHQVTARSIAEVQRLAPNAKIMLRRWEIDDNDGERKQEVYRDPKAAALKHAYAWDDTIADMENELHRNGWTYDKTKWYVGLLNEPDPNYLKHVIEYTAESIRLADLRGRRLGVLVPSVGNFGKPGEANSWDMCKPLEKAINDGGHILIVHEYWQPEGVAAVWTDAKGTERHDAGNLAWRHHIIPLNVPILVGEAGANGYIYGRHSQTDDAGWQKFMTPEQYAAQVREYIAGCDKRIEGVCLYLTDFHGQWWSFDTERAHGALLAIKGVSPQVESPFAKPNTVHLPIIENGGGTVSQPDLFERVMEFIRRWEGGYVDNPLDAGGATNRGITIGTLTRWRQSKGLPAPTKDDVRNLTREEADEIYRAWYWEPSGASKATDYPTALLLMDSGVLHGVGAPEAWVDEYGLNPWRIAARRLRVYTGKGADQWGAFGRGWTNRVAALLEEIGKA